MNNKLEKLKVVITREQFANILGVNYSFLNYILYGRDSNKNYTEFNIIKKSGGKRKILAPNNDLKSIQKKLSDFLLDCKTSIDEIYNLKHTKKIVTNTSTYYKKETYHLSHGFERKRNIVTNAYRHIKKKNVLNIDLEDFFGSFNFGRVRGFFIKNKHFMLSPEVATTIAQIACYDNQLPQGSPCSPVLANLITHPLDIRLNSIAKKYGCSYSRYADDITFSTRKSLFPSQLVKVENNIPLLSNKLIKEVTKAGFKINSLKTRVQFKNSRQDATGLVINNKVNVKSEYWRQVRAMAHSLFTQGTYSINGEETDDLNKLEGKLSFIDSIDKFNNNLPKQKIKPYYQPVPSKLDYFPKFNVREKTYSKFLYYKYFHGNSYPTILTEGKTDIVYLKCALTRLTTQFPQFSKQSNNNRLPFIFFQNTKKVKYFLELDGGSSFLLKFVKRYNDNYSLYSQQKAKSPVIMILDNDSGQNSLLNYLAEKLKLPNKDDIKRTKYLHIVHNLYLVLTPLKAGNDTCMEDLFEDRVLNTIVSKKTFNKSNNDCTATGYGKHVFSQEVIQKNRNTIVFNGFIQIFEAITEIIEHYKRL